MCGLACLMLRVFFRNMFFMVKMWLRLSRLQVLSFVHLLRSTTMQDSLRMLPLPLHSLKVPQVDPFNHIHFYLYCKMLCIYVTCRKIFLANNFKSVLTKNTEHLKCPLKMISMKMCSFSPHFCSDNTLAVLQPGGILAYPNSQHKATP